MDLCTLRINNRTRYGEWYTSDDALGNTGRKVQYQPYADNIDQQPLWLMYGNPKHGSVSAQVKRVSQTVTLEIRYPTMAAQSPHAVDQFRYGEWNGDDAFRQHWPKVPRHQYVETFDRTSTSGNVQAIRWFGCVSWNGRVSKNSNICNRYPVAKYCDELWSSSDQWSMYRHQMVRLSVSGQPVSQTGNIEIRIRWQYCDETPVKVQVLWTCDSAINEPIGTVSGTVTDASSKHWTQGTKHATMQSDGSVTISGTAEPKQTLKSAIQMAVLYDACGVSDGSTVTTAVDSSGNYGPVTSAINQPTGTVSGTVTDASGNTGPSTSTNYVDNIDPAAPVVNVTGNPDGSVTISGTAEPNSNIEIRYPDGSTVTTPVDSSGNYGPVTSAINQPTGTVSGTVTDASGNTGPSTSTNYVDNIVPTQVATITGINDNVAPNTGHIDSAGYSNDTSPQILGEISAVLGATEVVAIYRNDGNTNIRVGTATITGTGTTWIFDDSGLSDGISYTYTARVEDGAGNQANLSNAYVLNIDTTPPSVSTTINIVSITDDTGLNTTDFITNDTSLTINGTVGTLAVGETAQISIDGGLNWIDLTVNAGTWHYEDTRTLLEGEYTYQVRVVDAAGNIATDSGRSSTDFITNDQSITVNGVVGTLATDEQVQISVDGINWVNLIVTGGTWSYQDPRVLSPDGDYIYQVRIVDVAGNIGATDSQVIQIDTTAPTQNAFINSYFDLVDPNTGLMGDNTNTNDTTPTLIGSITAGVQAGGLFLRFISIELAYMDSHRTLSSSVIPLGRIGNAGSMSPAFTLTVDTTAPTTTVMIDSYTDNIGIYQGDNNTNTTTDDTTPLLNGTLRWSFQLPSLSNGSYTYYAVVVDAAGNHGTNSANFTLTIDTLAPTQTTTIDSFTDDLGTNTGDYPSGTHTDDTAPRLNGTISGGALAATDVVLVYEGTTQIGVATLNASRTAWTFDVAGLVNGDNKNYTAVVADAAGNLGVFSSPAFRIIVDTVAPTQTANITSYLDLTGPVIGTFGNGTTTDDRNPILNGTLSSVIPPEYEIRIYEGTILVGVATTTGGTNWFFNLPTLTDPSTHTYTVKVADEAGNESLASAPFTLTVDSTVQPEDITITLYNDDYGDNMGNYLSGSQTDDSSPLLMGTLGKVLNDGDKVLVYQVDQVLGTSILLGEADVFETSWSYQVTGLSDGLYSYRAEVVNSFNSVLAQSNIFELIVDTIAPTEVPTITVYNDTLDISITGTTWTLPLSLVTDGTYTYTAVVVDQAGNEGPESAAFTLILDTTLPTQQAIINSFTDDVIMNTGDYGSGLGANEVLRIYEGSTFLGIATVTGLNWTFEFTNILSNGSHDFTARVMDAAGNQGPISNAFNLIVDTIATSQTANINNYIDSSGAVTGLMGSNTTTDDTTPTLIWRLTVDATATLSSIMTDTAYGQSGNYSTNNDAINTDLITRDSTPILNVDLIAPSMTLSNPDFANAGSIDADGDKTILAGTAQFSSSVDGTAEVGSVVALINDINNDGIYTEGVDSVLNVATVAAGGTWNMSLSLTAGQYHLGYVIWDAAGNRSRLSMTSDIDVVNNLGNAPYTNSAFGTNATLGYGSR
ncbi:hypothetical protein FQR65_LT17367 [Abscondita terminalis]|nr:hypothetical protein FQR65_LT17367 [Abscondita terminalis]